MAVRAKFKLAEHNRVHGWDSHTFHTFVFRAEYDTTIPEYQRFAKATPNGELRLQVDNPIVVESWRGKLGRQFYLDITEAE